MSIRTLQAKDPGSPRTTGFRQPFEIERLCAAFGHNLGGNAPVPEWFAGWDVVAAVRQGTAGTVHMPVAALLRRPSDGALRVVVSDHQVRGDELGADLIIGPQHRSWAKDALIDSSDLGERDPAVAHAVTVLFASEEGSSDEPHNLIKERARDDDIADAPILRALAGKISAVRRTVDTLQGADRRAEARRLLDGLESLLGQSE